MKHNLIFGLVALFAMTPTFAGEPAMNNDKRDRLVCLPYATLAKQLDSAKNIGIVFFKPLDAPPKMLAVLKKGEMKEFISLKGQFTIHAVLAGTEKEGSTHQVSADVPIDRRWQGSETFHGLKALIPADKKGDGRGLYVMVGDNADLLRRHFWGPIRKSEQTAIKEAVKALSDIRKRKITDAQLRERIAKTKNRTLAMLLIGVLKQREVLTCSDFFLAGKLLFSKTDAALVNDVMYEASLTDQVRVSLAKELVPSLIRLSAPSRVTALKQLNYLLQEGIYGAPKSLASAKQEILRQLPELEKDASGNEAALKAEISTLQKSIRDLKPR